MTDEHTTHEHDADGPLVREGQDINVRLVVTIGAISALLLVVTVIGTEAWFRYEERAELQQKVMQQQDPELAALRQEAQRRLHGRIEPAIEQVARHYHDASRTQRMAVVPVAAASEPAAATSPDGE